MDKNIVEKVLKLLDKDIIDDKNGSKLYMFYNYFDMDIYSNERNVLCKGENITDPAILTVCRKLDKIFEDWEDILKFAESVNVDKKMCCVYLIYWLHSQVKDINFDYLSINFLYNKLSIFFETNFKNEKDNYAKSFVKIYDRNVLRNKKELYDFLEYYKYLRLKLDNENSDNTVYCSYIEYIFDVYNKMDRDYNSKCSGFYGEMVPFKEKFISDNNELNYIKRKCPIISKKLVTEVKKSSSCPSEHEEKVHTEMLLQKRGTPAVKENITKVESPRGTQEKVKLDDDISKKLPSLKIYAELKNGDNANLKISECDMLQIKDAKAKNICANVVKNLKKMTELDYKKEHNEYCLHFVRWLYEEIGKIPGIDWKNIYKNPDITKLFRVQFPINSKSPKYRCYYDFAGDINEWKEKADLLDYFQIFDKINNDTTCVNVKCKKNCTFFENINKLYKKHKKKCCTRFHYGGYFDNCLDYFKCDNKYNPKTFISKLKCQIEKSNENTEELDEPIPIDENVILKSLKSLSLLNFPKIKCNGLMCDTFSFTPFGTWLNKRLMKRRNSFTLGEDINYFQQNTLGRGNVNSQNRRINIAYQTA
ncbi:PIR Superfamily Protein [Plasmodium ovale curtisi]|uniref:PIR Superfamily Protein n=1 Tax=Plasmodium ovale curtisi TaxID=864141 RepID=A0A1A8WFK5_PLAOA|nr:PIR Superfamily Protein [Plasmodium ovale curtisi]